MGSTNHGNQEISWAFHEELTGADFNKRNVDICPRGIYKGGYLTRVSNSEVTLSSFSLEIGDDNVQISCKSSEDATLKSITLDSGSISSGTPYLVFRWAYEEGQPNNYVEVHAIDSVSNAQANDIIIGKCVFVDGTLQEDFDYTDRTFLNVQNIFLRVEEYEAGGKYVWVRAGKIQTSSQYVLIPEKKVGEFDIPNPPNSRIDLVYVDTDGTVKIQQGTAAVSPSAPEYNGKLVLAQVRLVNGDSSIPASRITDVRSFITSPFTTDDRKVLAKAWVNFAGRGTNGTCTINSSYNVTSVSRTAKGIYRVTFTSTFTNQYYVFAGFARGINDIEDNSTISINLTGAKTTAYCDIRIEEGTETQDSSEVGVVFFGL